MFKWLSLKLTWIIIALLLALAVADIIVLNYTDGPINKILIVLLVILLILLTILVQVAGYKSAIGKKKLVNYPTKSFTTDCDFVKKLESLKFDKRQEEYGLNYINVIDKVAYKFVFINDSNLYFNQEPNDGPANKKLEKAVKFVAIEIFLQASLDDKIKIQDFSFQSDKVYYTAMVYEDGKYNILNYLEANEQLKEEFNNALNILELKEEQKSEE